MNRTRSVLVLQILLLVSMNQIIIQDMKTQAKQRGMQSLFFCGGGWQETNSELLTHLYMLHKRSFYYAREYGSFQTH